MICFFVCFLEEIEDSQKAFRNYLTFNRDSLLLVTSQHSIVRKVIQIVNLEKKEIIISGQNLT